MRTQLITSVLVGVLGLAAVGCRGHNPNYRIDRGPARPFDGYDTLVIAPIAADGRWDTKFEDEARRCAEVVGGRARDYVAGTGVFGEVKADGGGPGTLFVRGGITVFNPGSRGGRIASSIIFERSYGQGYIEIHFDVHDGGPDGDILLSGICFSRVRGTGHDPMAEPYGVIAGALADMILDQVPPPPEAGG